ncbi:signal peptidase II [Brevundimonas sp.]|uniref:signal peptidase II n=1 Tax=Brevundimonas sp. TaxID=1871086 RepID=UPI003AF4C945
MNLPRISWAAYGFALTIIIVDQLTKAWVLARLGTTDLALIPNGFRLLDIWPPYLRFTYLLNDGVSFGLFGGGAGRWILSVFSLVVAGALAWWATRADRRLLITAIGLVMGGALGNVIDRIRFGGVVDFIDFSGTGIFPWVFNIADSAITIGVILLIVDAFLSERDAREVGVANEKS